MKLRSLIKNHRYALGLEQLLRSKRQSSFLLNYSVYVTAWLSTNPSTHFCSAALDESITALALDHLTPSSPPSTPQNKRLLVLTDVYSHGGHTRIIEHLLRHSAPQGYDLFLTSPQAALFPSFQKLLTDTQTNFFSQQGPLYAVAQSLRDLGKEYRSIMLMPNPEDIVPLLAFSEESWKTPLLYYNHADHRFWPGSSCIDLLCDMSSQAALLSTSSRFCGTNTVIPLPLGTKNSTESTSSLRHIHRISPEHKILLSVGAELKYHPSKEYSFLSILDEILSNQPLLTALIIGPTGLGGRWKTLLRRYPTRLILTGPMPHTKLRSYYALASVYLDSFPLSGFTALLEAVHQQIPAVALDQGEFYPDALLPLVTPYDEIVTTVRAILRDSSIVQPISLAQHTPNAFCRNIDEAFLSCPHHQKKTVPETAHIFKLDPYSASAYVSMRNGSNEHHYIHLLSLPLKEKLFTALFFLRFGHFLEASILLLFTPRRYQWLKSKIQ